MNLRIALRNLSRNRWRTALTAGGVAIAVAAIVWVSHMADAMNTEMIRSATAAELGDLQIHAEAYVEERNLFNAFPVDGANLDAVRQVEGVAGLSARVQAFGLVGHEKHSGVARLIGVHPHDEAAVTRTPGRVGPGRWLAATPPEPPAPREVVLGRTLARELKVEVGDELVVLLQAADGGSADDRLKVVGLVATGNSGLDRMAVWMHIDDLRWLTALEGRAHEVAIRVDDPAAVEPITARVREVTGAGEVPLAVRPWTEIVPELHQITEVSKSSMWIFYGIIYLIAALGIFNTQRMSLLERRRELGVLLAIGTLPRRLMFTLMAESTLLTVLGGLLGASLGAALSAYHQSAGFSFSGGGEELSYMGVNLGRIYFDLNAGGVLWPLLQIAVVGLLCGLMPAIRAARLDIPRAISGRL